MIAQKQLRNILELKHERSIYCMARAQSPRCWIHRRWPQCACWCELSISRPDWHGLALAGHRHHAGAGHLRISVMSEDRPVIGYTLEPMYRAPPGTITTHAFILCVSCGSAIDSHGGPRYNAVCLKCIDQLDLINRLKQ